MKTKLRSTILAAAIAVSLSLGLANAADNSKLQAAQSYQKGIAAYEAGNYRDAVPHFAESYKAVQRSEVAAFLASTYMYIDNAQKTLEFGKKALADKPALSAELRKSTKGAIAWATSIIAPTGDVELGGKADGFTSSKPQKPPPLKRKKYYPPNH